MKSNKDKWLHLRLNDEELKIVTAKFRKTSEQNISRYARKVLLSDPVVIIERNASLEGILTELRKLQLDLNGVGNNLNQMVHKLHMLDTVPAFEIWIAQYETERQLLRQTLETVRAYVLKTGEKWLR